MNTYKKFTNVFFNESSNSKLLDYEIDTLLLSKVDVFNDMSREIILSVKALWDKERRVEIWKEIDCHLDLLTEAFTRACALKDIQIKSFKNLDSSSLQFGMLKGSSLEKYEVKALIDANITNLENKINSTKDKFKSFISSINKADDLCAADNLYNQIKEIHMLVNKIKGIYVNYDL